MDNNNKKFIFVENKNYKKIIYRLISCGMLLGISVQSANADSYRYKKDKTTAYISIGQTNVKANELVYCQPISGCPVDHKLSQLIWDINNVAVLVAGLKFSFDKSSALNIEGKIGLVDGEGVMDDYDWQYTALDWSDWSHHEDTILSDLASLDVNLDFNLYGKEKTKLSFLVGYRKETWAWESRGGTYIYSTIPTDYRDLSGTFTPGELVISYEQQFTMPYLGFKFETILNKWKFNIQYDYSNQVGVSSTDHHHLRNLIFIDDFEKGTMSAYKMGIGYQITKSFDVYLRYDVQDYEEVRGNTMYVDSNTGAILGVCVNCAGADNSNQTLSIGTSFVY